MQTGTQILVERMKTHPEEFIEGHISKWGRVMALANDCLPDEDKAALKEAWTQAKIDRFNEQVLKTLAGEDQSEVEETIKYKAAQRYSTGFTDPRGLFGQAQIKGEGGVIGYDHAVDAFTTLTVGANGTSSVDLMPSAFGAVPRSSE